MTRTSMFRVTAALPLVLLAQVASAQALPPAASLLARYGAAVGGPSLMSAKAIVTKGGMSMPAAGLNATYEITQLGSNHMSMVLTIAGMGTVQYGFDGTTAWSADPMQGARKLEGKELVQMKDESDRRSMVRAADMFSAMETLKDTTINSERCYLVKLTWKSGRETYDCYSPTTGYLVASKTTQTTAMGDVPVLTMFSDYKKFGDVTLPAKTVAETMGQQQILTIESVAFGDGAGITVVPPPAVQAMVKPPAK